MAVHTLGSTSFLDLQYDSELYRGINTRNPSELISNIFPPVKSLTSKSENRIFKWLFGKVNIEGKGKVQVTYPYLEEHTTCFSLKNVDLSTVPYVTLKASAEEGWKFKGWYCSTTGKFLSRAETLTLDEENYLTVTGFVAIFTCLHENTVGI